MKDTPGDLTLNALLSRAGMSQKELSDLLGVSTSTISNWNNRKMIPRLDNAVVLCNALGCTMGELARAFGLNPGEMFPEEWESRPKPTLIDRARQEGLSKERLNILEQLLRSWGVNPDPSENSDDEQIP